MNDNAESKPAAAAGEQTLDIDLVQAEDWPRRNFPIDDGRRGNSVRVVIKQSVLNDIHRHGQSATDVEICGVLIGNGYRDERGPFVYVEANIRGQHSESMAAQVTFTGETWNHIHNELDRDWPDLQILGWYHTHPGFGIFLSGMDLFIHENYFSGEHQLALVYDPVGGDEGLFVWRNGKAVRDGFLIEPDAKEDPPPVAGGPPSEPMTAGAAVSVSPHETAVDPDLYKRLTRIENRQTLGELGIFSAILLALAAPLLMWVLWIPPQSPPTTRPIPDQRPAGSKLVPPQPDSPDEEQPVGKKTLEEGTGPKGSSSPSDPAANKGETNNANGDANIEPSTGGDTTLDDATNADDGKATENVEKENAAGEDNADDPPSP